MNSVELIDFRELILAGDMKYLRFVEKNSNKLYLVEYYTDTPIEVTIENLNKLTTIDDVKNYFISRDRNTNIFEFIETRDLKNNINTIKEMTADEKKMLTTIVKEIKNYNISYINFTYFFVETQDRKLYYAKLSKKTNEVVLKNLKIEMVIIPADIDVIIRDINAYGAFKYHNQTIKYEDILEYIDNPLISPKEELSWVINNVRNYESTRRVQEKIKEEKKLEENKLFKEEYFDDKDVDEVKLEVIPQETKPLDNLKEREKKFEPVVESKKKVMKKNKKKNKESKFKGSLMMYCLIGFTAGVLLAAITIVIGSFI